MAAIYFGFGLADSMFPEDCIVVRSPLTVEEVKKMAVAGVLTSCLNPSHAATVAVMRAHGINVEIPVKAPIVKMVIGDSLIVMGVSGLPRLEGRHEYTEEEIQKAVFRFGIYEVQE